MEFEGIETSFEGKKFFQRNREREKEKKEAYKEKESN